jgi:hypothetical protein
MAVGLQDERLIPRGLPLSVMPAQSGHPRRVSFPSHVGVGVGASPLTAALNQQLPARPSPWGLNEPGRCLGAIGDYALPC